MTLKQKLLKAAYPALMWFSKKPGPQSIISGNGTIPPAPFYLLTDTLINGQAFNFEQFKGRKILLVNTASDCGYTAQYEALEQLSQKYPGKLAVIGFPSNDFQDQEKGTDESIAQFCKINYGVTFPLMKKSSVKKSFGQNQVYQWLTDAGKNGWNSKPPEWNFTKYLIDENGKLVNYFPPGMSPTDAAVLKAIEN